MAIRKILRNQSAVLESVPSGLDDMFRRGRATSVQYRVQTPATPYPASEDTWSTGSIDSVSTTVQGAHEEGGDHLTIAASTTVVRNRFYEVDGGSLEPFLVQAQASVTGTAVYLKAPLPRDVANASTFKGVTCTASLTAADTLTPGACSIQWKATIDGVVVVWSDVFRIVRRLCAIPLTEGELRQIFPAYERYSPSNQSPANLIEGAWQQIVLPRLAAKGIQEEDILDAEPLAPVLAQATMLLAVRNREDVDVEFRNDIKTELESLLNAVTARTDWIETPQDMQPVPEHNPLTERTSIRMSR